MKKINIDNFVNNFVEGVENILQETNKITLYVDNELSNYFDIEVNDISETLLNKAIKNIVLTLISKGYKAYKSSSNEITTEKTI